MQQFAKDYHTAEEISLYVATPPTAPSTLLLLTKEDQMVEKTQGRLKRCYMDNPIVPNPETPDVTIVLEEWIHGTIRGSTTQLWQAYATFTGNGSYRKVVAKFFDPLYFVHENDRLDALQVAHRGVIGEYEAYNQLQTLQGKIIPHFFGLYIASLLPRPDFLASGELHSSRNIYVILIEHVPGKSLDKLDARDSKVVSPALRDAIMNEVFEIEAQALAFGLIHNDLVPRNVILRDSSGVDAPPALVMIDFEQICLVEPTSWDQSDVARAERIKELRATPDLEDFYYSWFEAGWLV